MTFQIVDDHILLYAYNFEALETHVQFKGPIER